MGDCFSFNITIKTGGLLMEPIREAEMQTQPGKRMIEESKKNGKVW